MLSTGLENGRKISQITNGANCLLFYWLLILLSTRFQPGWKTKGKTTKLSMMPNNYLLFYLLFILLSTRFDDNLPQKAISTLSGNFCPQMALKGLNKADKLQIL
jgi:hypothetical protein